MHSYVGSDRRPAALVTGASRGLGRAVTRELARAGWNLVIDARGRDRLEVVALEVIESGARAAAIAGDITDPAHRAALGAAARRLGGLDAVVNNAGALGPSPLPRLLDYPLADLASLLNANVVAQLGVLQAVRSELRPAARIVIVTSDAGAEPYPGWGGYGSSKAAVDQVAAVLAVEQPELRVYAFDPGDMRTDMHQRAFPGEDIGDRPPPEAPVPALVELLMGERPSGRYTAAELFAGAAR
jgi:NAD(P)-dependent dehydrogenase (short-subunit alcohol dehydrogenase family)